MEAIIARASTRNFGPAATDWMRAIGQLGRATIRHVQYGLMNYSRAAMLLRGEERPARRI